MAISFNSIPTTLRVPFVAVEFDSSRAQQGPALLAYRGLIIAQKLAAGTATADTLVLCTSVDQAITLGGRGSMIHRSAIGWFADNKSTELWIGVLADNGAGVAAQGTITVTASSVLAGTLALYLGGERVTVGVNAGDAQNTIATAIGAAINANLDLPITASVATNVVTWTHRHKGTIGQGYDVRDSFNRGEARPSGVSLAYAATTAGITNPTMTNLLAAMADLWFNIWTHPYTDSTSLAAIEAELALRFGPMRSQDALAVTSALGSFSTLAALGAARNSPSSLIVAQTGAAPLTPVNEFAANVAGVMALYGSADPARPFTSLALSRVMPTAETDQWSLDERNLLLFTGIATTRLGAGSVVQLDRMITTYQKSPSGAADTAYLDATTLLTLMYLRYAFRQRILARYPRHKLADDGNAFGSGQAVITPSIGKAEAVLWFREMEVLALVENGDQFKRDLVCVRSTTDPNRLEWLLPPDLINSLLVAAAQIQFRL